MQQARLIRSAYGTSTATLAQMLQLQLQQPSDTWDMHPSCIHHAETTA